MVQLSKTDPQQHFTQPPARYSEANLIKALEENGVGRPSTYAPTLDTIQRRYYVKLEARRFVPTELGEIVNDIIQEYFPDVVNVGFTASLEEQLDATEEGKENWVKVVDSFYKPFSKEVATAEESMEKIQIKDELAGFNCDICGAPMVVKMGRYGKFFACSRFPDCRNTKPIVKEIGVVCPQCKKGQVIERKSKKNRIFMVVPASQIVTLSLGISRLVVTARRMAITWSKRRSKVASKCFVRMAIIPKTFKNK